MDQLVPPEQTAARLNLRSLLHELLHFLQNDAASKEIAFDFSALDDVTVFVPEGTVRLVLLALITGGLDNLIPGSVLRVGLRQLNGDAVIEVTLPPAALDANELAIAVAKRWASRHGGRIAVESASGGAAAVRIILPVVQPETVDMQAAPA
jgi:signal transduction histidine kinase